MPGIRVKLVLLEIFHDNCGKLGTETEILLNEGKVNVKGNYNP